MDKTTDRPSRWDGRFYPGSPAALRQQIAAMTPDVPATSARAVMLPHAGYPYSGAVAAETLARTEIPEVVVLIGPKHTRAGAPVAINLRGQWRTPLGTVAIDEPVAAAVQAAVPDAVCDDTAHRDEHSLEVLVPLLQSRRSDVRIVPLLIGRDYDGGTCEALGARLAAVLPDDVLVVASSDMHHQGLDDLPPGETSQGRVQRLSATALTYIDAEDPAGLVARCRRDRISMCGVLPAAVAASFSAARGAHPQRVAVTDSQTVAGGDGRWVVGYAGYRWVEDQSGNA